MSVVTIDISGDWVFLCNEFSEVIGTFRGKDLINYVTVTIL